MRRIERFIERRTGWVFGADDLGYSDDHGIVLRIGNGGGELVEFEFGILGYTIWAGRVDK